MSLFANPHFVAGHPKNSHTDRCSKNGELSIDVRKWLKTIPEGDTSRFTVTMYAPPAAIEPLTEKAAARMTPKQRESAIRMRTKDLNDAQKRCAGAGDTLLARGLEYLEQPAKEESAAA